MVFLGRCPRLRMNAAPLALNRYVKRHSLFQGAAAWAVPKAFGIGQPSLLVSARVGHTPKKQTDAAGHMLDRVNKRAIDFHFDRRRRR